MTHELELQNADRSGSVESRPQRKMPITTMPNSPGMVSDSRKMVGPKGAARSCSSMPHRLRIEVVGGKARAIKI